MGLVLSQVANTKKVSSFSVLLCQSSVPCRIRFSFSKRHAESLVSLVIPPLSELFQLTAVTAPGMCGSVDGAVCSDTPNGSLSMEISKWAADIDDS